MKTAFRLLIYIPRSLNVVTKTFALLFLISVVMWIAPQKASAQVHFAVNFHVFYDNLSPYGNWVDNPAYGYVWIPNVSPDFSPYGSSGHWIYTYEGWTWLSDYSWGWAPFHYGRWFNDPYYGWAWIPDNEWGPGWVTWRRSNDYYGWAPIGPGISIEIAYSDNYNLPYNSWRFVRNRDFGRTNIYNYYVNSSEVTTIINNSTVINNLKENNTHHVRYSTGPDRIDAEKRAGKTFDPITIKEHNGPGHKLRKDQLEIYRPEVLKNSSVEQRPAPFKVVTLKEVKPKREKNFDPQPDQEQFPKEQPLYQPKKERPTMQRPNYEQQPRNEPARQQPNYRQPKQQPNYQQPKQQRPVRQQSQKAQRRK